MYIERDGVRLQLKSTIRQQYREQKVSDDPAIQGDLQQEDRCGNIDFFKLSIFMKRNNCVNNRLQGKRKVDQMVEFGFGMLRSNENDFTDDFSRK